MKNIKLNNGVTIPEIGLGTWLIDNDHIYDVVLTALKCGYTHFDSAQGYGNEENLGRAIKDSGVERESLFITSKVQASHKTYQMAKDSIIESLNKLKTDYIDLMLIHCPTPWDEYGHTTKSYFKENLEVWKALEEFYEAGKIRAIGISNFSIVDTKNIIENCKIKPAVNQIPLFIGCTNLPLIEYCQKEGILIEAYSPLAHGRALNNSLIKDMAKKYKVTIPQLCIRYTLQLNTVSLPKTTHEEFMLENLKVDFVISDEDMKLLMSIIE